MILVVGLFLLIVGGLVGWSTRTLPPGESDFRVHVALAFVILGAGLIGVWALSA